ncbi:uncharacterized protein [Aristolochia californica]|uniref:uncharacterized protein n=1 Tax=Aristolochia californica TaxID=171875 RepID=UPI0035E36840
MDRKRITIFCFLLFLLATDINASAADVTSNVEKKSDNLDPQNFTISTARNGSDAGFSKLEPKLGNQRLSSVKDSKGVDGGSQATEENQEKSESKVKMDLKGIPEVRNESQIQHRTDSGGLNGVSTSEDNRTANVLTEGRDPGVLKSLVKDNSQAEECDESNRCVDEKNKLIACIRVPGNDSPYLSLLIQNKGSKPLYVKITAPDHVKIEETRVQLKEKENKKVKVSVGNVVNNTSVNLTTGGGYCNIDFRDLNMLPNSEQKTEHSLMSTLSVFPRASALYLLLAIVLLAGSAWTCVRLWKRPEHGYVKVGAELPISAGGKIENGQTDGWDNSWGDGWGDEEAPKTPSKPVSSLSSNGLASRRCNNKDGWKD